MKEELTKIIRNYILTEVIGDPSINLLPQANLSEVGIQSIEVMEIVFFIEREFNCKLPTEFVYHENIRSIESIVEFLDKFLNSHDALATSEN